MYVCVLMYTHIIWCSMWLAAKLSTCSWYCRGSESVDQRRHPRDGALDPGRGTGQRELSAATGALERSVGPLVGTVSVNGAVWDVALRRKKGRWLEVRKLWKMAMDVLCFIFLPWKRVIGVGSMGDLQDPKMEVRPYHISGHILEAYPLTKALYMVGTSNESLPQMAIDWRWRKWGNWLDSSG